jgi:hypothetical protein
MSIMQVPQYPKEDQRAQVDKMLEEYLRDKKSIDVLFDFLGVLENISIPNYFPAAAAVSFVRTYGTTSTNSNTP